MIMSQKEQLSDSQKTRPCKRISKKGGEMVSRFLAKTYEILQRQEHSDIVCWNPEGNGFIVKNTTQFTEKILPRYFKHNNFASFVRQLNMYGFHKIKTMGSDVQIFTHEKFVRGNKDALRQIRRKVRPDLQGDRNEELRLDLVANTNANANEPELLNEVGHLKKKQEELERVVDVLVEQNKQILEDNKRLWKKMKKTMEREEKKFENILLLFLLNGGKNPQDLLGDNQIEGGHQTEQALLPVEQPKRQNILDALMNRFNSNHHKNNFKDQLYLHNQGQHMKLINNMVSHLNQNKEDKQILELEDGPSSYNSPLHVTPSEDKMFSPIPHMMEAGEDSNDLDNLDNLENHDNFDNLNNLSLEKGISSEFPGYSDELADINRDFLQQK